MQGRPQPMRVQGRSGGQVTRQMDLRRLLFGRLQHPRMDGEPGLLLVRMELGGETWIEPSWEEDRDRRRNPLQRPFEFAEHRPERKLMLGWEQGILWGLKG